jgi:VanZ family protein
MAIIFYGSTDVLSASQTSRFIGPFLRWFKPDISDQTIREIQMGIRKTGHVSEYAVLALLVLWALRKSAEQPGPWSPRHARLALLIAALYAMSDEIHQSFVPSRQGSIWDVALDSAGAAAGLILCWWIGRKLKKW